MGDAQRRYHLRHREEKNAKLRAETAARKAYLTAYKRVPCYDCGNRFPICVMDLHHRDPSTKSFGIGSGGARSWDALEAEVAKCDVLCANCHRIRTHGGEES